MVSFSTLGKVRLNGKTALCTTDFRYYDKESFLLWYVMVSQDHRAKPLVGDQWCAVDRSWLEISGVPSTEVECFTNADPAQSQLCLLVCTYYVPYISRRFESKSSWKFIIADSFWTLRFC
jgi:hypothetical protein